MLVLTNIQPLTKADKRAHHNALERKRRDHIKDSFSTLRDAVPSLNGEKVVRRTPLYTLTLVGITCPDTKQSDRLHTIHAQAQCITPSGLCSCVTSICIPLFFVCYLFSVRPFSFGFACLLGRSSHALIARPG